MGRSRRRKLDQLSCPKCGGTVCEDSYLGDLLWYCDRCGFMMTATPSACLHWECPADPVPVCAVGQCEKHCAANHAHWRGHLSVEEYNTKAKPAQPTTPPPLPADDPTEPIVIPLGTLTEITD